MSWIDPEGWSSIHADIIETHIFGLLFSNSEEKGDQECSFKWAKKNALKHFVHYQANNILLIEVNSILKLNMVTNLCLLVYHFDRQSVYTNV